MGLGAPGRLWGECEPGVGKEALHPGGHTQLGGGQGGRVPPPDQPGSESPTGTSLRSGPPGAPAGECRPTCLLSFGGVGAHQCSGLRATGSFGAGGFADSAATFLSEQNKHNYS